MPAGKSRMKTTMLSWRSAYQPWRTAVRAVFLLTVAAIGLQFTLYVHHLETGVAAGVGRPPGVEAFLPISALISLKFWIVSGEFSRVHPASLVILLAAMVVSVALKKVFCGWVCPVGFVSEWGVALRRTFMPRGIRPPSWLDVPLRGLKYAILFFFLYAIVAVMDAAELRRFLESPYNKIADVKMLYFFTRISTVTAAVLAVLALLSVFIDHFWCRYLCPYGALLGLLSIPGITAVRRDKSLCTGCDRCTAICPSRIEVAQKPRVLSAECNACLKCVDTCPAAGALRFSAFKVKRPLPAPVIAAMIVGMFVTASLVARGAGLWNTGVSEKELQFHVANEQLPYYKCNRGVPPAYDEYMADKRFDAGP